MKAVIFDMDGLILDTEKLFFKNWRLAAKMHGFEMSEEVALHIRSFAAVFAIPYLKEQLGEHFDYQAIRATRKQLMEDDLAKDGIPLKPGIHELLAFLHEQGIMTAVATATDYERTKRYLTQVGLFSEFDRIVCAPMVKVGKPAPDIYQYACEQLNLPPCDCLALEDSPNGVKSAYAAGCKVCMVPDLTQPDEEIAPMLYGCVDNLAQVVTFLAHNEK